MANYTVQIKPKKTTVTSVEITKTPSISLNQIVNVDATTPDDGETLVYDSTSQTYIVKTLPVVKGGQF
jgi:hypothetical protein